MKGRGAGWMMKVQSGVGGVIGVCGEWWELLDTKSLVIVVA